MYVPTDDGITIFDACPDQTEFRAALEGVGLPQPTVTEIGPVHAARTRSGLVAAT